MEEIEKLRSKLDEIDIKLLELIMKRIDIVRLIGSIKKRHNMPITDKDREEEVYNKVVKFALLHNMDSYQVKIIFREIMMLSKKVQNKVQKN